MTLAPLRRLLPAAAAAVLTVTPAIAQDDADGDDNPMSFSLGVTTDAFFGFAPMAYGAYQFHEFVEFSFYGIYWSGGTGAAWGNWAEFGVGLNFTFDGVDINPQLGVVSGNLLSKGAADGQFGGVFGDGLVPNITINFDKYRVESELYFGYYLPIRSFEDPETGEDFGQTAYIHYWASLGGQPTGWLSLGAHWEHLWGGATGDGDDVYQWIGPYIQFSDPKGKVSFSFAGGADLVEGSDSFYKMSMGLNF